MSSNLPLTFEDKVNSPELEAFFQQFGIDKYLSAEEINKIRDAINELYENSSTQIENSEEWENISVEGETAVNWTGLSFTKNVNFSSFTPGGSFIGFTGEISKLKDGNVVKILNSTTSVIPLKNASESISSGLKLFFQKPSDYAISPGEIVSMIRILDNLYFLDSNILKGNPILKASEKWNTIHIANEFLTTYINENRRKFVIASAPNDGIFEGFTNDGGGISELWDGCDLYIKNNTNEPRRLRHLSSLENVEVKLFFQNDSDYSIPPGVIAKFIFNLNLKRFELAECAANFLFEDIVVSLAPGKSIGRYSNGEIIPSAGKTIEQVLRLIAIEPQYPELIAPTFSLSHNQGTREVGTTVNLTLTASFNSGQILGKLVGGVWEPLTEQGKRAGAVTSYVIDGTNTGTTPSKNNPSYVVVLGNNSFLATVNYAAGPQPKDSENENFDLPLPAGSLNASTQFTGIIPYFYGVLNPGQTIDDINLASFTKVVASSSGTITIPWSGVVGKRLVVVYPATSTTKTKWWVTALNNGNIGNSGDLFPSTQNKNFNSPNAYWTGVSFKVIISDVTNADYNMEFRNS